MLNAQAHMYTPVTLHVHYTVEAQSREEEQAAVFTFF